MHAPGPPRASPNLALASHEWGVDAASHAPGLPQSPPPPCPPLLPGFSLGEAAADEDPAQRVLLALHRDWRADVQVAEGVKARDTSELDFPGYISKVRTLGENW